jgi:hypothetical protein
MVIVKSIPKYWVFGRNTDMNDKEQGLPPEYNIDRWRRAMACFHCEKKGCKKIEYRKRFLRKIPACFVSLLFKIRFFHCGDKWRGACEKFFYKECNNGR